MLPEGTFCTAEIPVPAIRCGMTMKEVRALSGRAGSALYRRHDGWTERFFFQDLVVTVTYDADMHVATYTSQRIQHIPDAATPPAQPNPFAQPPLPTGYNEQHTPPPDVAWQVQDGSRAASVACYVKTLPIPNVLWELWSRTYSLAPDHKETAICCGFVVEPPKPKRRVITWAWGAYGTTTTITFVDRGDFDPIDVAERLEDICGFLVLFPRSERACVIFSSWRHWDGPRITYEDEKRGEQPKLPPPPSFDPLGLLDDDLVVDKGTGVVFFLTPVSSVPSVLLK
jgi:hypothetical protein